MCFSMCVMQHRGISNKPVESTKCLYLLATGMIQNHKKNFGACHLLQQSVQCHAQKNTVMHAV